MFSLERNQICQTLTSGSWTPEWLDLVALKEFFFHQYNIYNTYISKKTSTIQLLYLRFRDHSWRRVRNTLRARGAGTLLWDVSPKNVRETYKEKQSSPVKSTQLIIQYHVSSLKTSTSSSIQTEQTVLHIHMHVQQQLKEKRPWIWGKPLLL